MAKDRFKQCTNCETLHIICPNYKDYKPSCFKCGRHGFVTFKGNAGPLLQKQKNIKHIFCDWNIQHKIEQSAEAIVARITKNSGEIDIGVLDDFKSYIIIAANMNRINFAKGIDIFR